MITFSSSELPSITHHSTIPSDLPIYTFLSYPSTQLISVLGPSSLAATCFDGDAVGEEVEVALLPAAAARDAADERREAEAAGGEDGPGN
jgi:hypothetical protein